MIDLNAPIPLVSAGSREPEDYELVPLRDRMKTFQKKEKKQEEIRPRSMSSSNRNSVSPSRGFYLEENRMVASPDNMPSLTDSVASSNTSSSTVISASKINKPSNVLATYRWDDESNGEIYNDKKKVTEDTPLYVVENGKEFPLTPVSKRKSFFMSSEQLATNKMPNDILMSQPIIVHPKLKREEDEKECELSSSSSSLDEDEDESLQSREEESVDNQTIKSSQKPYIQEEQEVLASINVVKKMKKKFLKVK